MGPLSASGSLSSLSLQEPLSVVLSSNQGQHSEIETKEQQSRIAGLPLELLENIFTFLNPKEYTVVSGVNREFRYLSKSLKQQGKFPVVIGGIILSYLEDHEVPSVEREFTLNDSIQLMKKTYKSEINTKSKKFSDLIRQQFERELKNLDLICQQLEPRNKKIKEISEQLESIEKRIPSDVTLKVLKVLDLKKKLEFFLLLKELSKETIEALEKSCQDECLWESFQGVFNWIEEYKEKQKYPETEIEEFVELSVQNNKEEMAIELAYKIADLQKQRITDLQKQSLVFKRIVCTLLKSGENEQEKKERYAKAIELIDEISHPYHYQTIPFGETVLALIENEQEKKERYAKAIELTNQISFPYLRDHCSMNIIDRLLKLEGNTKERCICYEKAIGLINGIYDQYDQNEYCKDIIFTILKLEGNEKRKWECYEKAIGFVSKELGFFEQSRIFQSVIEVLLKEEHYDKAKKLAGEILDQEIRNKVLASFP